jgi:hypothetical protein
VYTQLDNHERALKREFSSLSAPLLPESLESSGERKFSGKIFTRGQNLENHKRRFFDGEWRLHRCRTAVQRLLFLDCCHDDCAVRTIKIYNFSDTARGEVAPSGRTQKRCRRWAGADDEVQAREQKECTGWV